RSRPTSATGCRTAAGRRGRRAATASAPRFFRAGASGTTASGGRRATPRGGSGCCSRSARHASSLGRSRASSSWSAPPPPAAFSVGSLFCATAAGLECVEAFNAGRAPGGRGGRPFHLVAFEPRRIDWWAVVVQFAGTIAFNVSTFRAMSTGIDDVAYNRLVWAPDAYGSVCFLVSGYLAYLEVCGAPACRPRRTLEWWIAAVNLIGCIAFGISAVASSVVPSPGSVADLAAANGFPSLGGLCFLAGAVMLLPEAAGTRPSPAPPSSAAVAPA